MNTLFPLYFSPSMMGDIHRCDLFFFRKYCQNYNTINTNPDLIAGGIFASACELTRKAYFNEGVGEEDAVELGEKFLLHAKDTGHEGKSNERLAFAFGKYWQKYPLSDGLSPCKLADGTHAIEYEFKLDTGISHPDIPDRNIIFRGRLDGLYEKRISHGEKKRYNVDEKTTERISRIKGTKLVDMRAEELKYLVDGQMIGYNFAASVLGIETDGALVRRVPILKDHEDAFELIITISQWQREVWWNSVLYKLRSLVERYKIWKEGHSIPQTYFPPTFDSIGCHAYNRACQYLETCRDEHGEDILAMHFQQLVPDNIEKRLVPLAEYKRKIGVIS